MYFPFPYLKTDSKNGHQGKREFSHPIKIEGNLHEENVFLQKYPAYQYITLGMVYRALF